MNRFMMVASAALLTAGLSQAAVAASTYDQTKYPVVLVHGFLGFSQLLGAVDYFYGMPSALGSDGAKVFTPTVSPLNSNEVRGEELLAEVKTILATTGAAKVNLIGHSQGGATARYVAAAIPGNVASVTTIDGVGKGTPVADIVLGVNNYGLAGVVVSGIISAISTLEEVSSTYDGGYPINETAAMTSLSTAGSAKFNATYPNGIPTTACGNGAASTNGQLNYSWTGISQGTNILDPLDPLLIVASVAFLGSANDTMVGQCSTHFGTVLSDTYAWNHLDAINQTLGLIGLFAANPVTVMTTHVNRLKNAGV